MGWTSGKPTACFVLKEQSRVECGSTRLEVIFENWVIAERAFFGRIRCLECGGEMLYSRRLTKEEVMASKKGKPAKGEKPRSRKAPAKKRGRSAPEERALPGMEDHGIKPLEQLAAAYAKIRDKRILLNKEE